MASFCPTEGASSPNPCPGGTYSNRTGLVEPLECTSVVVDEWAPTGSSQPEPCPASGFRCPGRNADDVNEVPGSKPILVDSGDTTKEVQLETVTFDLALDLTPSEFDDRMEQLVIARLAVLYGVNASIISIEASISNVRAKRELTSAIASTYVAAAAAALASGLDSTNLATTTLATTTLAASVASTAVASTAVDSATNDANDHHLRRLSSSLLLTVTILVPTPPELEASADGSQADGKGMAGSSTPGDGGSDQPPAADGKAGGSAGYASAVDMKERAKLFAMRVGALNSGNFSGGIFTHTDFSLGVCAYLFNVTGANSTIVSEPEVQTSITNPISLAPILITLAPTLIALPTPTPHPNPTQVKTSKKKVSVACPKGYWCSAGLTVPCASGSYNVFCQTGLKLLTSRPQAGQLLTRLSLALDRIFST
jgi:hypothetical protein